MGAQCGKLAVSQKTVANGEKTEMMALDYPFEGRPAANECRQVAHGVGWVQMPLPFALDHVNVWLLEDGAGACAVADTGFDLPETRAAWDILLAGRTLSAIAVTHCHPDHIGLAGWLATRHGGVPIWMTQGEYLGAHALWHQLPGYAVPDMLALFRAHGLDDARLAALEARGNAYRRGVPSLPAAYGRLFGGATIPLGGREWHILPGYGHSPEHAALYCERDGLLISGDMLLPTISTNISVFAATPDADPLGWFLQSLSAFETLPADVLVLPSHGRPFRGAQRRVQQLRAHHAERCETLLRVLAAPMTACELLPVLFPRPLDTHQSMFAMGEAIAHLNHLLHRGHLVRERGQDGILRFARKP